MVTLEEAKQYYLQHYAAQKAQLPMHADCKLADLREQAIQKLAQFEFPNRKQEIWKYTSLYSLMQNPLPLALQTTANIDVDTYLPKDFDGQLAVFIDGQFQSALSRIDNDTPVTIQSIKVAKDMPLGEAAKMHHSFDAINAAFLNDGLYCHVPDNITLEKPIAILHFCSGDQFCNLRHCITLGKNAKANIIEHYVGDEKNYFTNVITEVLLDSGAELSHLKLLCESDQASHIGSLHANVKQNASFTQHAFALGGALVRSDSIINLNAAHASCQLNGLYLLNHKQHVDQQTQINHYHPHGTSRECYKGIMTDKSHAVFNGKVFVAKDAQKTDSDQRNQNLLLSKTAQIDTKPSLEIFADDVKCTHGATVGQIDKDALFYLQSRGIQAEQAKALLLHAFADELISQLSTPTLAEFIQRLITTKLTQIGDDHGDANASN